ncbi:MAG: hypothetical protein KIT27_11300 [Legionellales bacterium]|nr:hypothetical protein [Legionellales bacterium]
MFTYLNKQGVQSNKGFIVQRTGRFTSEYREGSRKITIELNNGVLPDGRFCEIIKSITFYQWDDGTPISQNKQKEILKNFTDAMEFQGLGVVVE